MRAIYGDAEIDSVPQNHPARPQPDNETLTIGDLLGLFSGVHPERQRASPPQKRPTSPTSSQPHHPAQPHAQPQPREHDNVEVNSSNILEFFHSIAAAQARGAAGGEQSTHEQSLSSHPEATPVDGKGKGKAKAQPVPEPTLFGTLFPERVSGAHDQELRDIEYAIKLSLQDRDATDVKRSHASKASQSSFGASSSKVKDPSCSGRAASPSVSAPVPEPVSPLTSIRAVRTQFSVLESAFKFPSTLDFDHSELAVTSNNAPVRAYEHALNGLLERLDAIESNGNEEVRDVRREVVREVERALEEVERKVKEQARRASVSEVTKQDASDEKSEDPSSASATQSVTVPPAVVLVTETAKPTLANLAPVVSQADADIDAAISAEYHWQPASPVVTPSGVVVAERDSVAGAAPANGETSTLSSADTTEALPASEDASDSIATITPAAGSVAPAVPVPSSSNKSISSSAAAAAETFLTQLTFPPRSALSQSSTNSGVPQDDDAVVVDNSSEGGSVRSMEDEWTTEF
ncbi:hypothetical protein F5888DRAFT_1741188 [Russula emetica]|nr:hypothetical protein F5888DRAFT_1741188 [Russula emetica]